MFRRILVAYDGGNIAMKALDKAIDLAKDTSAEIHLISVYSDNDIQAWRLHGSHYPANAKELFQPDSNDFSDAESIYVNTIQAEPIDKVRQAGITVHPVITKGKPHAAIIEHAKKIHTDLIVTGAYNRGAIEKLLLGSVSESILRNAPCPVMVVGEGSD